MKYKKTIKIFIFVILLALAPLHANQAINYSHLDTLEFTFTDKDGNEITSWAIYAEPMDRTELSRGYKQVEAPGEGYACVDDVARIAILFLEDYERTLNPASLSHAKKALEFVLYMEDGQGDFYNFIDKEGNINRTGITSKAGLDWWTARAFWALGKGIKIFEAHDKAFTQKMETVYNRTLKKLVENRRNPQIHEEVLAVYRELKIEPGALVNDSGAITSIFALGLIEKYRHKMDLSIEGLLIDYCNAMMALEETNTLNYPLTGFHYPTVWNLNMVHLYGNRQVKALAEAGTLFGRQDWIDSAVNEANIGYPLLLSSWGVPFALSPGPEKYPQIAYSVETVVSNLIAVYSATGKTKYAIMSGLFASWFFENNPAQTLMYNKETGICFDGIDSKNVNTNAGAESTIEALLALNFIAGSPGKDLLNVKTQKTAASKPIILPASDFQTVSGNVASHTRTYEGGAKKPNILIEKPAEVETWFISPEGVRYRVYLVYKVLATGTPTEFHVNLGDHGNQFVPEFSTADYAYNIDFVGTVKTKERERVKIGLVNKEENQKIFIDSVILAPQVQKKVWGSQIGSVMMVMNLFPYQAGYGVNLNSFYRTVSGGIYSSEPEPLLYLHPRGWYILEEGNKENEIQ
ncbi:MAG: hypothetical protein ACLFQV_11570 [Vulcanimicrobiota bacterium]